MVAFGPRRYDVPGFSRVINGVQPIGGAGGIAYGPMKSLNVFTGALPAAPRGFISYATAAGERQNIAFTESTWEILGSDLDWDELESGFSCPTGYDWSPVRFGDKIIASNSADGMWDYDLETPAGVNVVSTAPAFTSLWVQQLRVCGLYYDSYWRVAISKINDHTVYGGIGSGADEVPLKDGGEAIRGCVLNGNIAAVFQKNAIRGVVITNRIERVYDIALGDGVGSVGAKSIIPFMGMIAFISRAGFQLLTEAGVRPIGAEKNNRFLLETVSDLSEVQGFVDPKNHMFWWRLNSSTMVGWDWQLDEFVTATESTTFLCAAGLPASDMDSAEVVTGEEDMDAEGFPDMDSSAYSGGQPEFSGFNLSYQLGFFDGVNMEATLQTPEVVFPKSVILHNTSPITDAASATVSVAVEDDPGATMVFGSPQSLSDGVAYLRARGKRVIGQLTIPRGANWTKAVGFEFNNAGGR